mmetsp:Transcript_18194/g.21842  ORF Transcript_18194/g.21842 Transcript_18194/m.21842 type:complete len:113 (-) Transcript_18194:20-358(-)|eukprot:CAMPEP_0182801138 /NCGR_PEP_ID=MMETSP0006_2-20121128/2792_1 /TAXON_ID=97485 /ORGANISM="Prymnesium parvum, Strain Texoma1" /LENGTH=112 /DNA_ID=CAMNT_0024926439 /DNA_START=149 /DNA_END=487 /DNA_ORIENTATION=+
MSLSVASHVCDLAMSSQEHANRWEHRGLILDGASEERDDSRESAEANDGDGVSAEVSSVGRELLGDLGQGGELLDDHVRGGRTRHAHSAASTQGRSSLHKCRRNADRESEEE